MARTYNKEQKAYLKAKQLLDSLKSQEAKIEAEIIVSLGITNEDGSIPTKTWMIDDDETAEKAINYFSTIIEESGLQDEINAAKKALEVAEENLIQYALSIIPFKKEHDILAKAARENYTHRMKILEIVLRLNTKTVPR